MASLGLLLVIMGVALAVAEAHVPTHGALGVAAVAAVAVGAGLLVSAGGLGVAAALAAALGAGAVGAGWVAVVVAKGMRAQRAPVPSLIGRVGIARGPDQVFVEGALWRSRLWELEGETPPAPGDPVVVERQDGLTLTVRPAEQWEVV